MFAGELTERIVRRVEALLGQDGPPGVAVALVVDAGAWTSGIGYRDLERTQPLETEALLSIYSLAKMMIAAATMRLVARGYLTLDQSVVSILTDVPVDSRLTVRQLLNHTGGIADYGGMAEYVNDLKRDPGTPWSSQEFLSRVLARGPLFGPGQGWAYSNVGYLLLRQIVERITGSSLRQVLADDIFAPLGLRRADVIESLAGTGVLSPGYSKYLSAKGAVADVAPVYHPGWVSHGLVVAIAAEVAAFVDALFDGRVVTPELLSEMLKGVEVPGSHPLFTRPTYGLGLMIDPGSEHGLAAGHGGSGPGYSAGAIHCSDVKGHRVTSVALVNGDEGDLGLEIAFAMVEVLAGAISARQATRHIPGYQS